MKGGTARMEPRPPILSSFQWDGGRSFLCSRQQHSTAVYFSPWQVGVFEPGPEEYRIDTTTDRIEWFIEGQAFAIVWFGSSPTPPHPVSKLDRLHTGSRRLRKSDNLQKGEVEGGGRGAESRDCEKAWSSINHAVYSAPHLPPLPVRPYPHLPRTLIKIGENLPHIQTGSGAKSCMRKCSNLSSYMRKLSVIFGFARFTFLTVQPTQAQQLAIPQKTW